MIIPFSELSESLITLNSDTAFFLVVPVDIKEFK